MKKIILFTIAIFSISSAFSQTEQGKVLVGATSSFSFTSLKFEDAEDGTNSFDIAPQVGYFIIDNLSIGLGLDLSTSSTGDFKSNTVVVGPFVRYYFLEDHIRPFLQADYAFGSTKNEFDGDDEKNSLSLYSISGGAAFFLNEYIALEGILGYAGGTTEFNDGEFEANFSGFALNFGFSLYF